MVRRSNGIYLQVLTARPQAGVNLEVTVWDGANPATMLAELQGASEVKFQDILSDVGSGSFRIARDDPKATTANIRDGNLVKVRLNDVDLFPFWIEAPKLVVSESGASHWEIAGAGALSCLVQAVVYPPGWPVPSGGDRAWTSATAGLILKTLVDEAQARGALAHVTYDFDATVDSHAAPWPADLTLTVHAGTTVLDVAKQLAALGVVVRVTPQLVFQAFAPGTYGRDLSTSVVWRYGRHVIGDVASVGDVHVGSGGTSTATTSTRRAIARTAVRGALQNAELVEGAGGVFIEVNDPASQADPYTGRREGGLSFTSSKDPTTLQGAGNAQMAITQADANAIQVPLNHGASAGLYTPYADYQPGDWVSLDVPGQYEMERLQVIALTLDQTPGGDYTVDADLNAVALDYLVRLRNMMSARAGTASQASGGASGSLSYGAPPPTGTPVSAAPATASAPGDTAAAGVSSSASAGDHRHGREAWGAAADVGAESFGVSSSAGVTGRVADAGHVHAMPAAPSVPSASGSVASETSFGASPAAGSAATFSRGDHTHGSPADPTGKPLGLTGAVTPTRYAGATVSGAPVSGTFAAGDFVIDLTPAVWVCTAAGTPGTWAALSGGGGTPASTVTGPDAYGASPVVGTSADYARADHDHGLPAAPSGTVPSGTAVGDLLVWDGSAWSALAVGPDTDALTADSTQALGVKWAAGGGGGSGALVLLEQHTASSSATLDFTTAISSTYDEYLVEGVCLVPATNAVNLLLTVSADGGSTWKSSSYDWSYIYGGPGSGLVTGYPDSAVRLASANSNGANGSVSFSLRLFNPLAAIYTRLLFDLTQTNSGDGNLYRYTGSGEYKAATALNALRFAFSSGNIASGTVRVYGIAK